MASLKGTKRPTYGPDFWARVDRSAGPTACWPWRASLDTRGYGHLWWKGRLQIASRVAIEVDRGFPLERGECALHRCDNPICVNPAHLFVGTKGDNNRDAFAKGRQKRTGSDNGRALLEPWQIWVIRRARVGPGGTTTRRALAERFGVTESTIANVRQGRSWQHIMKNIVESAPRFSEGEVRS